MPCSLPSLDPSQSSKFIVIETAAIRDTNMSLMPGGTRGEDIGVVVAKVSPSR